MSMVLVGDLRKSMKTAQLIAFLCAPVTEQQKESDYQTNIT